MMHNECYLEVVKEKQRIVKLCDPWGQFCAFADPADPDPTTLHLKLINDCQGIS